MNTNYTLFTENEQFLQPQAARGCDILRLEKQYADSKSNAKFKT